MVFLNLRQRTDSVQALVVVSADKISKQMVKWTAGLADESIVLVEGVVKKAPEPINSASVQDVELHITQVRKLLLPCEAASDPFYLTVASSFRIGGKTSLHHRRCEPSRGRLREGRLSIQPRKLGYASE